MGYHAGKPIESVVYCLIALNIRGSTIGLAGCGIGLFFVVILGMTGLTFSAVACTDLLDLDDSLD